MYLSLIEFFILGSLEPSSNSLFEPLTMLLSLLKLADSQSEILEILGIANIFQLLGYSFFIELGKCWFWNEALEMPPLELGSTSWSTLAFDSSFSASMCHRHVFPTSSSVSLGMSWSLVALTRRKLSVSKKPNKPWFLGAYFLLSVTSFSPSPAWWRLVFLAPFGLP